MTTASVFGSAFDKLDRDIQFGIAAQLRIRKYKYLNAMKHNYVGDTKVVIIADTPGPGRPDIPGYHHTPFYSTKNSSLWLNKQLIEENIDELSLLWFNSTLANGDKLDSSHVKNLLQNNVTFIVLGGNAEKWFKDALPNTPYKKVYHPQFAKRFKSKEKYALIDEIKKALT